MRVLIVDQHALVADALSFRLGAEDAVTVVGSVASAEEAVATIDLRHPDVTVVDVDPGARGGLALIERIANARPPTNVVLLTDPDDDPADVLAAIRVGVKAVAPKTDDTSQLVEAVQRAARGQVVLPAPVLAGIVDSVVELRQRLPQSQSGMAELSHRELEVLTLLARGLPRPAIADALGLSVNTVRTHVKRILQKLGVRSGIEAAAIALRAGLGSDAEEGRSNRPDAGPARGAGSAAL